jgi:hypothetical protein
MDMNIMNGASSIWHVLTQNNRQQALCTKHCWSLLKRSELNWHGLIWCLHQMCLPSVWLAMRQSRKMTDLSHVRWTAPSIGEIESNMKVPRNNSFSKWNQEEHQIPMLLQVVNIVRLPSWFVQIPGRWLDCLLPGCDIETPTIPPQFLLKMLIYFASKWSELLSPDKCRTIKTYRSNPSSTSWYMMLLIVISS